MDVSALVPTPDAIPVSWGWFSFLLLLTFFLHILFMNAMLGGGIIALISSLSRNKKTQEIAREISYKWPYTIALAVNMGVAPLLFLQVIFGHFIYTSSILMAAWWLSIILLLIIAYYSAYIYDFRFVPLGNLRIVPLAVTVILLLTIAFLFTNNMTLMLQPDRWTAYFANRSGTLLNLSDPIMLPRFLHFVTGSVAVAGLYLVAIGRFRFARTPMEDMLIAKGLRYFIHATILQACLGLWFLFALPSGIRTLFLGASGFGTLLLLSGLTLAGAALYFALKKYIYPTLASTLLLLIVMILMRDLLRSAYLKPHFSPADLTVVPQYSPMVFFFAVLIAGLFLILYMIKLAFKCRKEVSQ